jgi:hypothetical protein
MLARSTGRSMPNDRPVSFRDYGKRSQNGSTLQVERVEMAMPEESGNRGYRCHREGRPRMETTRRQ